MRIATLVFGRIVRAALESGVLGHCQDQLATAPAGLVHLTQSASIIIDMLDDIRGADHLKCLNKRYRASIHLQEPRPVMTVRYLEYIQRGSPIAHFRVPKPIYNRDQVLRCAAANFQKRLELREMALQCSHDQPAVMHEPKAVSLQLLIFFEQWLMEAAVVLQHPGYQANDAITDNGSSTTSAV